MHTKFEPDTTSSHAAREVLDEALFCTYRSFDPAELPVFLPPVPKIAPQRHAAVHCVVPDFLSAPVANVEVALPPCPPADSPTDCYGAVSDAGGSYQLTNLAPGLYEVRRPAPAPAPVIPAPPQPVLSRSDQLEKVPTAELHVSERVEAEIEVNVGSEIRTDETASRPETAPAVEPTMPERLELRIEVNAGLDIHAGEKACLGSDILRLGGADSPGLIDVILLSPPTQGVLLRDGFALTGGDVFTQEDVNAGRISYRHEGAATTGEDAFSFATPEGEILPTQVTIRIVVPHRAPRLLGGGRLDRITQGVKVSKILDAQIDSVRECGIAIVGLAGSGVWAFSSDAGRTWHSLGTLHPARASLHGPSDWLRFTARQGVATVARLTYRAWDQSSHQPGDCADLEDRDAVGGSSAFSQEVTSATSSLEPTIALATPRAADPWLEPFSAADLGGGAVALVRLVGVGTWQYSVSGAAWRDCKSIYHGRALLLGATDRLRFVPHEGASGHVALTFRSWDGEGARGGHARLSAKGSVGEDTGFGESVQSCNWYLDAA